MGTCVQGSPGQEEEEGNLYTHRVQVRVFDDHLLCAGSVLSIDNSTVLAH